MNLKLYEIIAIELNEFKTIDVYESVCYDIENEVIYMIKREQYLKRIRPFYDSEMIKIITGVRRCGKSVLLKQIKDELMEMGHPESEILYLNFEDYKNRKYLDPDVFYELIEEQVNRCQIQYLLCDEIQNVENFELVINSTRSTHEISIFLTGSNSKLLSNELSTHLSGRTISFRMMPFTFQEYLAFKKAQPNKEQLIEYLEWGGFPLVCNSDDQEVKEITLTNLYDSIVLKDIVMRNKISSPHALNKIIEYLIGNSSSTISAKNIVNMLKQDRLKLSVPTVYDYIRYIEAAGVIDCVERYDIRGKKVLSFEEKIYVCDLGLLHLKKNRVKDEFSLKVETCIYNECIARGYHVYIGKTKSQEIDFIIEKSGKKAYIQAAYLLDQADTIEREFHAFDEVNDHYPKYVISFDEMKLQEKDGIIHMPMLEFLMNDIL